jgi:8-oxo-dGTP pyrophosphatase MutT (NUDIX family)
MSAMGICRLPLMIGVHTVGSVLPSDAALCPPSAGLVVRADAVHLPSESIACNVALAQWASALHAAKRLKTWRHELLRVSALPDAEQVLTDLPPELAQLERGAARVLGVLTHAVHLVGLAANGDVWLQHRALNKATDPGLWDTLAGGLLAAGDTLHTGLLRETYEEAGLIANDLHHLAPRGMVQQRRSVPDGLILEAVWTYSATLASGAAPRNLDGEVMGFDCVSRSQLANMVSAGTVTQEAVLALTMAGALSRLE